MANNAYVNKVQLANGTVLIDISDTTAAASDVAAGKVFYTAAGVPTTGTASGSGSGGIMIEDTLDTAGGTIRQITAEAFSKATLLASANGSYTAPSGTLWNQVEVSVSGGGDNKETEIIMRTISGTYENSSASIVGVRAFDNCVNLSFVSFPNATTISSYAFYQCSNLVSVYFPSATEIEGYAFYGCTSLNSAYFQNVSIIQSYAFNRCSTLSIANFQTATLISSYAFAACSAMETAIFPSVTEIGSHAFDNCSKLSSINANNFPNVISTDPSAFYYCSGLITASFPNLQNIGNGTFINCRSLNTCILNHTSIENGYVGTLAFASCYRLLSLYLLNSSIMYQLAMKNTFSSTPISNYTTYTGGVYGSIFVPEAIYSSYISATNWATFSNRFVSLTDTEVQNVITYGKHNP